MKRSKRSQRQAESPCVTEQAMLVVASHGYAAQLAGEQCSRLDEGALAVAPQSLGPLPAAGA